MILLGSAHKKATLELSSGDCRDRFGVVFVQEDGGATTGSAFCMEKKGAKKGGGNLALSDESPGILARNYPPRPLHLKHYIQLPFGN